MNPSIRATPKNQEQTMKNPQNKKTRAFSNSIPWNGALLISWSLYYHRGHFHTLGDWHTLLLGVRAPSFFPFQLFSCLFGRNITTYVTSYLRKYDKNIEYQDTVSVYAVALFMQVSTEDFCCFHDVWFCSCSQAATMMLGGWIASRIGTKKTALLG